MRYQQTRPVLGPPPPGIGLWCQCNYSDTGMDWECWAHQFNRLPPGVHRGHRYAEVVRSLRKGAGNAFMEAARAVLGGAA